MKADQMEPVIALVDPDEVVSLSKFVFIVLLNDRELLVHRTQIRCLRLHFLVLFFIVLAVIFENLLVELILLLRVELRINRFFEGGQTDRASPLDRVILCSQHFAHFFVQVE